MSDKAAGQKARSPEGCDENGPAAALLLSHVLIQICSFVAPCRRPILIATPLHQSLTWCTSGQADTHFTCELGMGAGHKCRHLLMADLNVIHLFTGAPNGANDAIDAVARKSIDSPNSPLV